MASIKAFKKDVNNAIGMLIDAIYYLELSNPKLDLKKSEALIDEVLEVFDGLIAEVHEAKREGSKAAYQALKANYTKKIGGLEAKLQKLA
jgi:predicted nucleotide-binding protein (sugar kinase/HSP70/actin superfamily)